MQHFPKLGGQTASLADDYSESHTLHTNVQLCKWHFEIYFLTLRVSRKTIHLPVYKKGQVSNCDVTFEVWTQKAQLADGKSVQSAYQKCNIHSVDHPFI